MNERTPQSSKERATQWNEKWGNPSFSPPWMAERPSAELEYAIEKYDICPDDSVLDVGCGNGILTCELALRFPNTVGVDLSSEAIAIAEENAATLEKPPVFLVGDVMQGAVNVGGFNLIHDRGCLHTMDAREIPEYARIMRQLLGATGHLFITHRLDEKIHDLQLFLTKGLAPHFTFCEAIEFDFGFQVHGTNLFGQFLIFRGSEQSAI